MKKNFLIVILLIIILALVSFLIYYIYKENGEPKLGELIVSDEPIEGVTKNINENIDLDTETVSY